MILDDHRITTIRILLVLIEFFLLCRTLSDEFWRSFNFQGQVHFHNRQIYHERFNPLLVIRPIKFRDGRELRKTQSQRINKRAMSRIHVKQRRAICSILQLTKDPQKLSPNARVYKIQRYSYTGKSNSPAVTTKCVNFPPIG